MEHLDRTARAYSEQVSERIDTLPQETVSVRQFSPEDIYMMRENIARLTEDVEKIKNAREKIANLQRDWKGFDTQAELLSGVPEIYETSLIPLEEKQQEIETLKRQVGHYERKKISNSLHSLFNFFKIFNK